MVNGTHRQDRARVLVVAAVFAALIAGATAAPADAERAPAAVVSAPLQPVGASGSPSHARSRFGILRLRRSAVIAGAGPVSLRATLRADRDRGPVRRLRIELRRGQRPFARAGRSLDGLEAGEPVRVRLRGLVLDPARYRLVARVRRPGGWARAGSVGVRVLAQHRLTRGATATPAPSRSARVPALAPGADAVNHDLTATTGSEPSSAVALDRGDPGRVIAAANPPPGTRATVVISNDGMAPGTVLRRPIPGEARLPGAEGGGTAKLDPCCSPALTVDDAGNAWAALTAAGSGSHVVVARIPGPATTRFGEESTALPRGSAGLQDAPAIEVDDWPASPRKGWVYVAWIENDNGSQRIVVSGCDGSADPADCEDPDSWTPGASLPSVSSGTGLFALPHLAVSPAGDLYAIWWDAGSDNAIEMNRCTAAEDCSLTASWDEETKIADLDDADPGAGVDPLPFFCPAIAAPAGRISPSPGLDIDAAGNVYAVYSDLRGNGSTRCTATGTDSTWDSYVATGPGGTFPALNSGVRVSADGAGDPNDHFLPALTADASTGEVEVGFYSTEAFPSGRSAHRYYTASADSGASFSAPQQVSSQASRFSGTQSDGFDYGDYQGADSGGGVFAGTWTDNRLLQARDSDLYMLTPPVSSEITSAPSGTIPDAISSFRFQTIAPQAICSLDGGATVGRCTSPHKAGPIPNGPHTLMITAADRVGNPVDPSPPVASWTILDETPPETRITKRIRPIVRRGSVYIRFRADEKGVSFRCRFDDERYKVCSSPHRQTGIRLGRHSFRIRATDVAGNVEVKPAFNAFVRRPRR